MTGNEKSAAKLEAFISELQPEFLQDRISTLEKEIKELNLNKQNNEKSLLELETQKSNLIVANEKLTTEKNEAEALTIKLQTQLKEMEVAFRNNCNTNLGLEMELGK